ncbi:MAG: SDR family NAD(P)-dependent oxidoreductase [Tenuifilaceae bacterium]|jgi:short-subunit dehydrogenase|nr:SDR family NAD(P)-dependent oxidoreductase [Tenuifilaceae bacterium]
MIFKDKLCWVTGASSGIGEALAYELAKQGAKLIISSNDATELKRVQKNCLAQTTFCEAISFDLSNPSEVNTIAKDTVSRLGNIYLLINNGGISQRSLAHETPIEIDRRVMEIDFFSYLILTKAVVPGMISQGEGYIAATSSISGKFGFPYRSAYAAAKHAIQGYFETLRLELKPLGISVTIAYPGRVNTKISLNAITNEGKSHGVMDPGQANGISAEECARQYIRAIERRKPEKLIGGKELLMVHIKRLFPKLFFRIVGKISPT